MRMGKIAYSYGYTFDRDMNVDYEKAVQLGKRSLRTEPLLCCGWNHSESPT